MSIDQAKQNIGKMVMSLDAFDKCITKLAIPHGPYPIHQVTKSGLAILGGRAEHRVPPSLIELCKSVDYICEDCKREFLIIQKTDAFILKICPLCGGRLF